MTLLLEQTNLSASEKRRRGKPTRI